MKFALVIPDGCADEPQAALDGRTPLQAARTPHMDAIAQAGRIGRANHTPDELPSGSDVGTMSLFGYDPKQFHTGRAPIEAAAQGIELGADDWAIRCNLVTIAQGVMESFTAHQIPNPLGRELITLLQKSLCGDEHWKFQTGVSYRNLLLYRARGTAAPFSGETRTVPPHDVTGQAVEPYLPQGPGSEVLRRFMQESEPLFADCSANVNRTDGHSPATGIWLWGEGRRPALTSFQERFGRQGAVITAVDLLRGLGALLGWKIIEVEGATGYLDTDYAAKGQAAIAALDDVDLIVVHVEATDEASHEGDVPAKVEALERIDHDIVQPLHAHLQTRGDYRLLVCPDHPTFLRTRTHSHGEVPFAFCGTGITADEATAYDEITAGGSSLALPGHELMPLFVGDAAIG